MRYNGLNIILSFNSQPFTVEEDYYTDYQAFFLAFPAGEFYPEVGLSLLSLMSF